MHDEANRARRVAFAKHVGDLTVSHYASTWYAPNDLVNAFAILSISFPFGSGCFHRRLRKITSCATRFATRPGRVLHRPHPQRSSAGNRLTRNLPPALQKDSSLRR